MFCPSECFVPLKILSASELTLKEGYVLVLVEEDGEVGVLQGVPVEGGGVRGVGELEVGREGGVGHSSPKNQSAFLELV